MDPRLLDQEQLSLVWSSLRAERVGSVFIDAIKDHIQAQDDLIARLQAAPPLGRPAAKSYLQLERGAHYDLNLAPDEQQDSFFDVEFRGQTPEGNYIFSAPDRTLIVEPANVLTCVAAAIEPSLP
jgi:hypothetical protein